MSRSAHPHLGAGGGAEAEGGVIERCGHWAGEERPDFVADLVRQLAKSHAG